MEIRPIDDSLRFGELNPDGSIKRDVKVCAVTGQPIEPGDAMIPIAGTNRFYRLKAPLTWPQNRENFEAIRPELEARVKSPIAPSEPTAPDTLPVKPPRGSKEI